MHVVIVIETCRVVYALGISVLVCMYKYYYQEHYLLGQMVTPHGQKISGYNNYTERDGGFNAWSLTTMKWL